MFIPEIWSALAIEARFQRLVWGRVVDHRYEKEMKVGDTLNVPSRTHLTAQTKARNSNAAIVFETQTETNTQITVTTWEYSAIAVESIIKVQANRDLLSFYASEMGYALDLAIDDVLAGLPDDVAAAYQVGSLATGLSYQDLLEARRILNASNAPQEGRHLLISPDEEANILNMEQFIHRDYSEALKVNMGTDEDHAWIGHWMRMPVWMSTNIEGSTAAGHDNCMLHESNFALVRQMQPTSHSQYDINYFVDKVAMENVHGSRAMRTDHAVWLRGK